jgi:Mrp family chromosome partitioning ATPase
VSYFRGTNVGIAPGKFYDSGLLHGPVAGLLAVSDALVMGPHLDGAILVVRGGQTSRDALRSAREMLDKHKIRTLGVIINDVRVRDYDYYYMGRYYKYYGRPEA